MYACALARARSTLGRGLPCSGGGYATTVPRASRIPNRGEPHPEQIGQQLLHPAQRHQLLLHQIDRQRPHLGPVLRPAGGICWKAAHGSLLARRAADVERLLLGHHQAYRGQFVPLAPHAPEHRLPRQRRLAVGTPRWSVGDDRVWRGHQAQRLAPLPELAARLAPARLAQALGLAPQPI
jgi:hypothetical protein